MPYPSQSTAGLYSRFAESPCQAALDLQCRVLNKCGKTCNRCVEPNSRRYCLLSKRYVRCGCDCKSNCKCSCKKRKKVKRCKKKSNPCGVRCLTFPERTSRSLDVSTRAEAPGDVMHISSMSGTAAELTSGNQCQWRAIITIHVVNQSGDPVSAAQITGRLNGKGGPIRCSTNSSGICMIEIKRPKSDHTLLFKVESISKAQYTYDGNVNENTPGLNSDGTTVLIQYPRVACLTDSGSYYYCTGNNKCHCAAPPLVAGSCGTDPSYDGSGITPGVINGTVKDGLNPLPGVLVVDDYGNASLTNSDGIYMITRSPVPPISGINTGPRTLTASKTGFVTITGVTVSFTGTVATMPDITLS